MNVFLVRRVCRNTETLKLRITAAIICFNDQSIVKVNIPEILRIGLGSQQRKNKQKIERPMKEINKK